eukprot:2159017-Amphidinium_carterae.1
MLEARATNKMAAGREPIRGHFNSADQLKPADNPGVFPSCRKPARANQLKRINSVSSLGALHL